MAASTPAASRNTRGRCVAADPALAPVRGAPITGHGSRRGGYNGYRIPDNRFKLYFGNNHFFRISRLPLLFVGGFPRFQYDGYWVTFVDPWPETWSPTWYETATFISITRTGIICMTEITPASGSQLLCRFN